MTERDAEDSRATVQDLFDRALYVSAHRLALSTGVLTSPGDVHATLLRARILQRVGANRRGRLMVLQTWRNNRTHPEACLRLVWEMLSYGPLRALELMQEIGDLAHGTADERHAWLLTNSVLLTILRDFSAAEQLWETARHHGETPWSWCVRAQLLAEQDDVEAAIDAAKHSLELRPWFRPSVEILARDLRRARRPDEAFELLVEASAQLESASVTDSLAGEQTERGDYAGALETLERLATLLPELEEAGFRELTARFANTAYLSGDVQRSIDLGRASKHPLMERLAARLEKRAEGKRIRLDVPLVPQHHNTCGPATLTSIAEYWDKPVDHVELAENICHDGTSAHSERRWARDSGWAVREFTISWDATVALIDAGVPFTLTTVYSSAAHLQVVMGYDSRRKCVLIRDPSNLSIIEADWEKLEEYQAAFGPRGLAIVPKQRHSLLDAIQLQDVDFYDRHFELEGALANHHRNRAQELLDSQRVHSPTHRLTLLADRSIAHYDDDPRGVLRWADGMLASYPDDARVLIEKLGAMRSLATTEERLTILEQQAAKKEPDPTLLLELARALCDKPNGGRRAESLARRAIAKIPTFGPAYCVLADVMWERDERDRATQLYRFASTLSESDEGAAWSYLLAARHIGELDAVLQHLARRVGRMGSRSGAPAQTLRNAYVALDRDPEGLQVLERAIADHPDDGPLLLACAQQHLRGGDESLAEEYIEKARPNAKRTDWLRAVAELRAHRKDLPGALEQWREVASLEPLAMDAQSSVADLIARVEGRSAAIEYLREQVDRFPHHFTLRTLLYSQLEETDDDEARTLLAQTLERNPDNVWARTEHAIGIARRGDHAKAREHLEQAAPAAGRSVAFQLTSAHLHELAHDRAAAADCYRTALRASIDATQAIVGLLSQCTSAAETETELEFIYEQLTRQVIVGDGIMAFHDWARDFVDPEQLIAQLSKLLAARRDSWSVWSVVVRQHMQIGNTEQALALATEAAEKFPLLPGVWRDLAAVYEHGNDREKQIEMLLRALAINPNWHLAVRELSEAWEAVGETDKAKAVLERAVAFDPLNAVNHGYLADLLKRTGDTAAAIERLKTALRMLPSYSWAWDTLAEWTDSADDAIAFAEQLSGTRGRFAEIWVALADMMKQEPIDRRLELLDEAIRRDPSLIVAHNTKAVLLAQAGRFDEAIATCRPKFWRDRQPVPLRGRAAWILRLKGDRDGAMREMQAVISDAPDYAWGIEVMTQWALTADDLLEYLEVSKAMVAAAPRSATALAHLGEAHRVNGERTAAAEYFEKALAVQPKQSFSKLGLFDVRFDQRRLDEAEAQLEGMDNDAYVQARRVKLAARRHHSNDAALALDRLCELEMSEPWPIDEAVDAMIRAGDSKRAMKVLDKAMERDDAPDHVGRAWAVHANRRGWWVWRMWRRLARLPVAPAAEFAAATYLETLGERRSHVSLLWSLAFNRQYLRSRARIWGSMGYALLTAGFDRLTHWWLKRWREIDGVQPWMLSNLIRILRATKRYDEALSVCIAALDLPQDHTTYEVQIWSAVEHALAGEVELSRELLQAASPHDWNEEQRLFADLAEVAQLANDRDAEQDITVRFELARTRLEQLKVNSPFGRDDHAAKQVAYVIRELRRQLGGARGIRWGWSVRGS